MKTSLEISQNIDESLDKHDYFVLDVSDYNMCLIGKDKHEKIVFSKKGLDFNFTESKNNIFKKRFEISDK